MKSAGLRDCPVRCPNEKKKIDIYRTKYCDECPRTREMRIFREQTRERWEEWLGEKAGCFDFDTMLTTINHITGLDDMTDDRIGVKSAQLRSVYRSEREKAKARLAEKSGAAG
jgi:hypothetical protein